MISGIHNSMESLHRLSSAQSRSITPENLTGDKGKGGMAVSGSGAEAARDLGQGWKLNPYLTLAGSSVTTIADIEGCGAVNHIWMTVGKVKKKDIWRDLILRVYWDGQQWPSVEVPIGDFFCNGWNEYAHVDSLAVCVNPARGFNCYWTMPGLPLKTAILRRSYFSTRSTML